MSVTIKECSLACWFALMLACGSAGTEPGTPEALPHAGTGEFRPLTEEETGVAGSDGRVLFSPGAMDTLFVHSRHLFFGGGLLRTDAMDPPSEPIRSWVDWTAFQSRKIFRAVPFGQQAFRDAVPVLSAEQSWEGESVSDPCIVETSSGQIWLYYVGGVDSAGQGGVGVAVAQSIEGDFLRTTDTPILGRIGGVLPRRPSVVQFAGEFLMYVSVGDAIHLARSPDGMTFTPMGPISLGEDLFNLDGAETGVTEPGALTVTTGTGRKVVRLYFVSLRDDGTRAISIAASLDGVNFERFQRPVTAQTFARSPSPVAVDDRVTLLYTVGTRISRRRELGAAQGLVTPGDTDLSGE